jgi:hypothetical protein
LEIQPWVKPTFFGLLVLPVPWRRLLVRTQNQCAGIIEAKGVGLAQFSIWCSDTKLDASIAALDTKLSSLRCCNSRSKCSKVTVAQWAGISADDLECHIRPCAAF